MKILERKNIIHNVKLVVDGFRFCIDRMMSPLFKRKKSTYAGWFVDLMSKG